MNSIDSCSASVDVAGGVRSLSRTGDTRPGERSRAARRGERPGLKDGDGWCVCATWYARAVDAGKGCPIYLKKTHEKTLKLISIQTMKKFAIDLS